MANNILHTVLPKNDHTYTMDAFSSKQDIKSVLDKDGQ